MKSSETIEQEILDSGRLPECPPILAGLAQALEDPDVTVSDLSILISDNQVLMGKILGIVNSEYYGLSRQVMTVDEAAFRLGFRELWSLAVATQFHALFSGTNLRTPEGDSIWEHSLRVAVLARGLATRAKVESPEEMFSAGVMHDIGKLALSCYDPEYFRKLNSNGLLNGPQGVAKECEQWGTGHAALGAQLLRRWGIPEPVVTLVEYHHKPAWSGKIDANVAFLTAADALDHASSKQAVDQASGLIRMDYSDNLLTKEVAEVLKLNGPECILVTTESMSNYEELLGAFT